MKLELWFKSTSIWDLKKKDMFERVVSIQHWEQILTHYFSYNPESLDQNRPKHRNSDVKSKSKVLITLVIIVYILQVVLTDFS